MSRNITGLLFIFLLLLCKHTESTKEQDQQELKQLLSVPLFQIVLEFLHREERLNVYLMSKMALERTCKYEEAISKYLASLIRSRLLYNMNESCVNFQIYYSPEQKKFQIPNLNRYMPEIEGVFKFKIIVPEGQSIHVNFQGPRINERIENFDIFRLDKRRNTIVSIPGRPSYVHNVENMIQTDLSIPGEIIITFHRTKDQPNMTVYCDGLSLSNVEEWKIITQHPFISDFNIL